MRRFENDDFPYNLAEGVESVHLDVPDDKAQAALSYIRQFVYRTSGTSKLTRGYISEDFIDALVRVREINSNRKFNHAVEQLGADGETSTEVTEYDELTFIEVENSSNAEKAVTSIVREHSDELSDEARLNLYSIRDLIRNNRDTVVYYLPKKIAEEIMPHLDEEGILL